MALSMSRSTAEVAETVNASTKIHLIKINQYLHQGLIFSTCAAMPLQSRITDAARRTAKTLLHVHEYPASLEVFTNNFSDVPNLLIRIRYHRQDGKKSNKPDQEQSICRHLSALQQDQCIPFQQVR